MSLFCALCVVLIRSSSSLRGTHPGHNASAIEQHRNVKKSQAIRSTSNAMTSNHPRLHYFKFLARTAPGCSWQPDIPSLRTVQVPTTINDQISQHSTALGNKLRLKPLFTSLNPPRFRRLSSCLDQSPLHKQRPILCHLTRHRLSAPREPSWPQK